MFGIKFVGLKWYILPKFKENVVQNLKNSLSHFFLLSILSKQIKDLSPTMLPCRGLHDCAAGLRTHDPYTAGHMATIWQHVGKGNFEPHSPSFWIKMDHFRPNSYITIPLINPI